MITSQTLASWLIHTVIYNSMISSVTVFPDASAFFLQSKRAGHRELRAKHLRGIHPDMNIQPSERLCPLLQPNISIPSISLGLLFQPIMQFLLLPLWSQVICDLGLDPKHTVQTFTLLYTQTTLTLKYSHANTHIISIYQSDIV